MDTRLMTYAELAAALRIAPDSARRLVARRKWTRRPGNDGRARIAVPIDKLQLVTSDSPPDSPPDIRPHAIPDSPPTSEAVAVLQRHIERLEGEIARLTSERDAERARASQVEALQTTIEIERARVSEWQAVADRWASQAERLAQSGRRRWWLFG